MIVAPLIASLTPEALAALSEHRVGMLRYAWDLFAGDWVTWLYMAGRGAGKTRTASEWIRQRVYDGAQRIAEAGLSGLYPLVCLLMGTVVHGCQSRILAPLATLCK